MQGAGSYSGTTGSAAVCSAFGAGAVGAASAAAVLADDGSGSGLVLYVVDPSRDTAGLLFPLAACPAAAGQVSVAGATLWDQASVGGATFYAQWAAQSATVTFTAVSPKLQGTFQVALPGGGSVTGAFDLQ